MARSAFFLLLFSSTAVAQLEIWPLSEAQKAKPYYVIVRAGSSSGSGICIWSRMNRSLVATCSHVVSDEPHRVSANGIRGWLIANDRQNDVAIIEVPGVLQSVPLHTVPIKVGDVVESYAYPSMRFAYRRGPVIGKLGNNIEARYVCLPGQSGAGVLLNGQLIGLSWGASLSYSTAVITPARFVQRLLKPYLDREAIYERRMF